MKIELKQSEIVAALAQYISSKGISLNDKAMAVTFTVGRKQSGISAELTIDDDGIPDFDTPDIPVAAAPVVEASPETSVEVAPTPVTEETFKTASLFA